MSFLSTWNGVKGEVVRFNFKTYWVYVLIKIKIKEKAREECQGLLGQ